MKHIPFGDHTEIAATDELITIEADGCDAIAFVVEGGAARYVCAGEDPTTTRGFPLADGASTVPSVDSGGTLRIIAESAAVSVQYQRLQWVGR